MILFYLFEGPVESDLVLEGGTEAKGRSGATWTEGRDGGEGPVEGDLD